jgi:Tfp pilus assembly protein PilV
MKKHLFFIAAALLSLTSIQAQDKQELVINYKLRTPQDKTIIAMEKLKDFKLSPDAAEKTNKVIGEFYKDEKKMLDGAIANGVSNVDAYKAKKQKLAAERDDKLKKIFTQEQYNTWVTVIEPGLRQRPRPSTAAK